MTTRLKYYTCDVFTDTVFGGNPLAVIPQAEGLDDATMQSIAREFNFSETTFVLPPTRPDCDVRVRIFTPTRELPFAGHPTLGTAHVLAVDGRWQAGPDPARIVLEEGVGPVPVELTIKDGRPRFARLRIEEAPELGPAPPSAADIAACLQLEENEIGTATFAPVALSLGFPMLLVPLADTAALDRAALRLDVWRERIAASYAPDMYLFAPDAREPGKIHARMFGPSVGVPEDPATGSAAVTLCAYLALHDPEIRGSDDVQFEREIVQGVQMGRPSLLSIRGRKRGGRIEAFEVGGSTVMVSEGVFLF